MKRKSRKTNTPNGSQARYPRHDVDRALRIANSIVQQNAGKECTERDSARYVGVGYNGPFRLEISSGLKYGFLERPKSGYIKITERARKALRPQRPEERVEALREAILQAPQISDVYSHYRGE